MWLVEVGSASSEAPVIQDPIVFDSHVRIGGKSASVISSRGFTVTAFMTFVTVTMATIQVYFAWL